MTVQRSAVRSSATLGIAVTVEATARRREASSVPYRLTQEVWAEIQERLREGWSPDQISGRFRMEGRPIGRQIIYDRIRADRKAGGDLWKSLRRRGKKRNWRGGRHAGRGHIPNRVDISERPGVRVLATGRPIRSLVKHIVAQLYRWLTGSRNTHCWHG